MQSVIQVMGQGAVEPIKDAPLDQASYQELAHLNNDLTETLGATGEREINTADTATQASLVDNRLAIREGDDLDSVVDWIRDAAEKMDKLVQVHITRDEAVAITGPQGDAWELVRTQDFEAIDGEFEYSVNVGTMQPRLPHLERAQVQSFLQVLGAFPQIMGSPALMTKLAEMHRLDDEKVVAELVKLGQQINSGQIGAPGQSGGGPGNPISAIIGAARGQAGGAS